MKNKKKTKVIALIIFISFCLIGILIYVFIPRTEKFNCVICSIENNDIVVIECKWIKDKVKATEAGLLDYYKNYFEEQAARYRITVTDDITIKNEKGRKVSLDYLRPGDEIEITKRIGMEFGYLGTIENVKSIRLKEKMLLRVD